MPIAFEIADIRDLNVRNISIAIDALTEHDGHAYELTSGLMAIYDEDTCAAFRQMNRPPAADGTGLDAGDCLFCIEGLLVHLFEPHNLKLCVMTNEDDDQGNDWCYDYHPDTASAASTLISDPVRFYREHFGLDPLLVSPQEGYQINHWNDLEPRRARVATAWHWNRLRGAMLSAGRC